MHAADRNTNCVQHNKTHVDKSARCRANSRPRTHNDRKWSASVRTPSRDRNSRHEYRDPNTTLQHETRHAGERVRDSSTLEAARLHENADMMGVSGLCHKTMNNTRPKWQNPDTLHLSKGWASGWSRPSHLLMIRLVNLFQSFFYGCPVPLDQKYGGLQGPYIRSCSPKGLWFGRLVLNTHSSNFILWTWTLPQVPRCSRPSANR